MTTTKRPAAKPEPQTQPDPKRYPTVEAEVLAEHEEWGGVIETAARAGDAELAPWTDIRDEAAQCRPMLTHIDTGDTYQCTEGVIERVLDNWFLPAHRSYGQVAA